MPEDEHQQQPPDAVLIHVEYRDDGSVQVRGVERMGQVRPTEVETLLGAARRDWRRRLGIE